MNCSRPGPQSVPRASPSLYILFVTVSVRKLTVSERKTMNCNQENLDLHARAIQAPFECVLYLSKESVVVWISAGFFGVLFCQKLGCGIPISLSEDKCRRLVSWLIRCRTDSEVLNRHSPCSHCRGLHLEVIMVRTESTDTYLHQDIPMIAGRSMMNLRCMNSWRKVDPASIWQIVSLAS
jgi:hypothetical protein